MFITEIIVNIPASKINFWIPHTQIFVTARNIVCVCVCVCVYIYIYIHWIYCTLITQYSYTQIHLFFPSEFPRVSLECVNKSQENRKM